MSCVGISLKSKRWHAAQNRDRNLVHLGRGEDELHVRRRLFERLQERVPRVLREHVDFVHDEDLVAIARRAVGQALLQPPHLVDAVVAGAVDFLHVHVGALRRFRGTGHAAREAGRRRWAPFRSSAPWP